VIEANGRDSRGNGTANATVTASLAAEGADRTAVSMVTDMTITGKPAQFGRGVISDVADKIITQFAECVARKLAPAAEEVAEEAVPVAATAAPASEATSDIPAPPAQPARRAPTPAGGSEAISDSVAERTASSNGAAPAATEVEAPVSAEVGPGPASTTPVSTPLSTARAAAAPASAAGGTGLRAPVRSEVDAIDLLDTAGAPVLQRLVPVLGGGLLLVLVVLLIRRLRAG